MFGIKSTKLEAWFESLPADTRKKLEETTPDKWNVVLASILSNTLQAKEVKPAKVEKSDDTVDQAAKAVKDLGAASVSILMRELSVDEAKAIEILKELEQKGIVETGELHSIRRVYNANREEEVDDETVAAIVAHLLEHQTISAEVLKNKFALNEKVIPVVLDSLEQSGFISAAAN